MKERNVANIRETLEQVSTQRLDEMLQEELQKDHVDEKLVRLILSVLEDRDGDSPLELTPEVETAWVRYLARTVVPEEKHVKKTPWLPKVASIAAVLLALIVVAPQEAEATGFFERIAQWTESVFEFFSPGSARFQSDEYVFETDNPGLQEIYDRLVELGVTEPVVPMWLPEGYELLNCESSSSPIKKGIRAAFRNGNKECIITVDIYNHIVSYQYEQEEASVIPYEVNGTAYFLLNNYDYMTVVWNKSNLECMITIECQEEIAQKIINSINGMGE